MHEARLVRFRLCAEKAHLGAALQAIWLDVETLEIINWHDRTPAIGVLPASKLWFGNFGGNQLQCVLHRLDTLRTTRPVDRLPFVTDRRP
jgi:hypothetical protein